MKMKPPQFEEVSKSNKYACMRRFEDQVYYWAHMLDEACESKQQISEEEIADVEIQEQISRITETTNVVDCPYLYITELNKSLNPPCRKIGRSDGERILVKLRRYSTTVPKNWKPYIIIFVDEANNDIEEDFIEFIVGHGRRIENKELIIGQSAEEIKKLVAEYLDELKTQTRIKSIWCNRKYYGINGFKEIAKKKGHVQIGLGPIRRDVIS